MPQRPSPPRRSGSLLKTLPILLAALLVCSACAQTASRQPAEGGAPAPTPEQPQATAATPAPAVADASPGAAPAALADVQGALARVYHDAVTLQAGRATPFVVGDFNGDDSQDIAVVVTPASGKLSQINSEYANWLVGDPRKVVPPEVRGDVKIFPKRPEPVVVRQDDLLLAVIHGYRQEGWRNPMSAQTFLLRNAVGDEMRARPAAATDAGGLPQLRGDVIQETLAGQTGFIYWTGAKYAWSGAAGHGQRQAP